MIEDSHITAKDVRYHELAIRIAADSICADKHGTVIVKGNRVLAVATNRFVSHPVSVKYLKKSIHSEQRAILRLLGSDARYFTKIKGAVAYTARIHDNPISKPCEMCHALLFDAGITKVVYSDGQKLNVLKMTTRPQVEIKDRFKEKLAHQKQELAF